ncbi:hypothetical protein V8D89_005825 [Ganoderma adspersum]
MSDHAPSPEPQGRPESPGEDRPSQSRSQSPARSKSPARSQTERSQSAIRGRTSLLHNLLEDAVAGRISDNQLLERLHQHNATPEETSDIIDELADRRRQPAPKGPGPEQGGPDPHTAGEEPLRDKLSWAIVQAKIDALRAASAGGQDAVELLDALRGDVEGHGIPESVLAVAPHLKDIVTSANSDSHLARTFEIRESFARDKVADRTIAYLQLAKLDDPLPKAIWRDILADKYVNFEKVYAAIDSGFDHDDDAKDFAGGYVLLKKDQANARKAVESETDWTRVFDAWASAVKLVYRHRGAELDAYKRLILKLFRARRSEPHVAILIDHDVREDYAKSPFHLDDRAHSDVPLFTHLVSSSPSQASTGKRPGSLMARIAPAKRATVVCENWNFVTTQRMLCNASGAFKPTADGEADLMAEQARRAVTEGPRRLLPAAKGKRKAASPPPGPSLPRFRRRLGWRESDSEYVSPAATGTETAPPLPRPPQHLLDDPSICATLDRYRDEIKVETPFHIERLRSLLSNHPNQPFVESVLWGLENGFWPLDDGDWDPNLDLFPGNYSMEDPDLDAVRAFRDREVGARRWSGPIDPHLSPCMKTSPMFVVWQNEKARVVTDHSASGLNDGIPRSEAKVRYDDMHDFGQILFDAHRRYPDWDLTLYKSDVSTAFLNLPAHPVWQLRQVVTVDDDFHIVRRLVFGSRASPRIWCSVSALLCWIAIHKYNIRGLVVYMDDFFGWDFSDPAHLLFFHGRLRPSRQVRLLLFWAYVMCPFDDPKQLDGRLLKIIGFWNDVVNFTISMPPSVVDAAVEAINRFLSSPDRKARLRDWQRLAGHLNWILNVIPWGRPALTEMYRKTANKINPNAWVFLNREVTSDLIWFRDILPSAIGVRLIDQGRWGPEEADITVWTDAALRGVQTTIRGSRKTRADPVHRKAPLRLSHLASFQTLARQTGNYDDFLFLTILTAAFFACHRIGELVAPNDRSLWDWRKLIRRQSFSADRDHATYHLPYHKGDPFYQGTDIRLLRATASGGINPVQILRDYVSRRDHRHGARTPLFLRADGSRPTRSWFERRLFSVLPRSDYGGHSARAGGATHFASLGLSEDVLHALGRWSSQSWSIYIRDHPTIRAELELVALRHATTIPRASSSSTSSVPHTQHP